VVRDLLGNVIARGSIGVVVPTSKEFAEDGVVSASTGFRDGRSGNENSKAKSHGFCKR
jgi:hypothetical protein